MIRLVPDTNVIISSVFWRGNAYKIIASGIQGNYTLVTSPEIIDEVIERLKRKFRFPEAEQQNLIDLIFTFYEIVEPSSKFEIVRDKKDNKIIECAFDGKADYIVTGDKDLQILKIYKNVKIVSPSEFVSLESI